MTGQETRSVKIEEELLVSYLLPILLNLFGKYLTKEAAEVFGDFKIGGQLKDTAIPLQALRAPGG
jgi:hypothetical protein